MSDTIYTLGVWRVKPDRETEFVAAWKALGATFARLADPPSGQGTLIQSLTDPALFYSFGSWPSLEAVQAMRQDPEARGGIDRLRELCSEAFPGSFRLVAQA